MKNSGLICKFAGLVVALGVMFTGCASMEPKGEPDPDDGLVLVPFSLLDELYVAPNVSLANYKRVMLDPIEITFRDGWRKDHSDMSDRDFEAFKTRITGMLREKLVTELAHGGYTVVDAPAPDVLRLRPSITNAEFAAPESASDKKVFVRGNCEMTLRVQGFDSPSGALVARAKDYEQDPEHELMRRADRTSTNVAAQKIFDKWAESLRSALDVAKVSAGARTPQT